VPRRDGGVKAQKKYKKKKKKKKTSQKKKGDRSSCICGREGKDGRGERGIASMCGEKEEKAARRRKEKTHVRTRLRRKKEGGRMQFLSRSSKRSFNGRKGSRGDPRGGKERCFKTSLEGEFLFFSKVPGRPTGEGTHLERMGLTPPK